MLLGIALGMALSDRPSCYSASSAFELMLCWLLCNSMRQQLKHCPRMCCQPFLSPSRLLP